MPMPKAERIYKVSITLKPWMKVNNTVDFMVFRSRVVNTYIHGLISAIIDPRYSSPRQQVGGGRNDVIEDDDNDHVTNPIGPDRTEPDRFGPVRSGPHRG